MNSYDLVVIGAGWAGFNAALRAKELGLKVCLIEKRELGGTCLNLGCIPTKTLIHSAKIYSLTKKLRDFGLEEVSPQINLIKIQERKDNIIRQLRLGMQNMLGGIDYLNTPAQIFSKEEIRAGDKKIKTRFIIIASGSRPIELEVVKFDGKRIISSDQMLNLKDIPSSLLVIGGGIIGCEFASLFSSLGSQVTIVEKLPQLIPGEDKEIARKLGVIFKKRGIKVNTNTDASTIDSKNYCLTLVCVGRNPETSGLGLNDLGIKLERSRIVVDEYLKTNIDNILAAGDCTAKFMLAHFAAYQGTIAAENIARPNNLKKADNLNIPNCIFTDPEIASVGLNEEEAKKDGRQINIDKFFFLGSGMARISNETDGFIKIISETETKKIIGASIIGPRATEIIGILTLAITNSLGVTQLKNTCFAHPTISECVSEALKKYAI